MKNQWVKGKLTAVRLPWADISLSKFHSFDNNYPIIFDNNYTYPKPRIFVICIACYNMKVFYGRWIDVSQDIKIINREINSMLSTSPAENAQEWAIYACGGFGSLKMGKDEDIEQIRPQVFFIATYGELSLKLLEYFDDNFELAQEAMEKHYQGKFGNELEFAEKLLDKESAYLIPDFVKLYIDYESFKNSIFENDYYAIETIGGVHVFSLL